MPLLLKSELTIFMLLTTGESQFYLMNFNFNYEQRKQTRRF